MTLRTDARIRRNAGETGATGINVADVGEWARLAQTAKAQLAQLQAAVREYFAARDEVLAIDEAENYVTTERIKAACKASEETEEHLRALVPTDAGEGEK